MKCQIKKCTSQRWLCKIKLGHELKAVHDRHVKVDDYQVELVLTSNHMFEGQSTILGLVHFELIRAKISLKRVSDHGIIIDEENMPPLELATRTSFRDTLLTKSLEDLLLGDHIFDPFPHLRHSD